MAIVAEDQIDVGRGLLAACSSLTGVRASGTVQAIPQSVDTQVFAGNYLLPIINGQLRQDLPFKIAQNETMKHAVPFAGGAGGPLSIVSNAGGIRHNLPAGTVFRFDPPLDGIAETAVLNAPGTAGGQDPSGVLGVKELAQMETLAGPATGLEFFRTTLGGRFPAIIAQWLGSEPADGLATSTLARGSSRVGEGAQLYAETWAVSVIVSKSESESVRRAQGLRLMNEVTALLTDRQTVDGVVISHPSGVQIRGREQVSGLPRDVFQAYQIYQIELAVTGNYQRRDTRTYADLLRFKLDVPKDADPDKELVVGVLIANPQPPP